MENNNNQQQITVPPQDTTVPLEEEVAVSFIGEPRENLTIRKSFRLTPTADAEIKKLTRFAYVCSQKGLLKGDQMKDDTIQAYINFALDCARSYLEEIYKKIQ
jgi:hypothetical protein